MERSVGLRGSASGSVGARLQDVAPDGTRAFARVGLTFAGLITVVALTCSAVMIWLCLTQPFNLADVIGRGEVAALFRAVAAFVVAALERAVHYL